MLKKMLRRTFSGIMLVMLFIAMLMLVFEIQPIDATPRTIIVPTHYPTISEAISFASDGDTIYVLNGTYKEDYIQVDKSIKLIGENKYSTIIEGSVMIVGDNIELKGFNITKVFPQYSGGYAVLLHRSNNVTIEDNIIQCNSGAGIYFQNDPGPPPQNITILGNNVLWYNVSWETWVYGGIYVGPLIGDDYSRTSRGLKLLNNRIEGWPGYAVAGFLSGKNEFTNNTILNNRYGMGFGFGESGNIFRGNIINVTEYGFSIWSKTLEGFLQNIDTSNLINGRSVYYLVNQSNKIIERETYPNPGFFGLVNSQNVTLQNLDVSADLLLAYVTNIAIKNVKADQEIQMVECKNIIVLGGAFYSAKPIGSISIRQSEDIVFEKNDISKYNFYLWQSKNSIIRDNSIKDGHGVSAYRVATMCLIRNHISNNTIGLYLDSSNNITVSENFIGENRIGLRLFSSNDNFVYLNNFIYNEQQLELEHSFANTYDNGYEGNYWSDYNGTDTDRDGIGDTNIPHQKVDWLPLMGMVRFVNIEYGEELYGVYTISNSTLIDGWLNETLKTLNFNVSGAYNTIGFCRIKLPKEMGSELLNNNYTILVNGNEPFYVKNWTTNEYALIYFEYEHPKDLVPPITLDDYDCAWHNSDFTITLTATDYESGVAEIYYRINEEPVKAVSVDGQPFITTEGANNTLEYWSVDNAGNEELPHKILTGIKLDKTKPLIVEVRRQPEGDVEPDQKLKVLVNTTDLLSGIRNVTLSYNVNTSTIWIDLPMTFNSTTGLYEVAIQVQQTNVLVKYKIVAYDKAGNHMVDDNSGQYYVYKVIPEFPSPSTIILPLLMATTVIATVLLKKKRKPKPQPP
jgi:parallel beta-helix repeat protein